MALFFLCCNSVAEDEDGSSCSSISPGQLEFSQFDICKVLTQGASLLASEGAEYDAPTDNLCEW